jgi:hypothetical protein
MTSIPTHGSARSRAGTLTGCLLAGLLVPGIASAALGQDSSTVERDVTQLRAQRSIAQSSAFSVHELQLPGGTRVREYLTAAQQVFAVTWSGPSIPDLQQLLGTYFPRFEQSAARATGRGRQAIRVQESDLVIQSGGHSRAFFGMAYLPKSVPTGVRIDQIQ